MPIHKPHIPVPPRGALAAQALVEKSFEFLLEREGNESILRSFDLPVIGRYFPDYESTIQDMLR